ncbi:PDDEXK nuclease domain-containing protein [Microbacterium sp. 4R-513]|uniref:PDDEXK nuclease domain-containing protein n=1 Tax=Microbacterium sp. 4R-513 TaxID=2567934 RepID=UPI0019D1766C|nr:PDDEXK nuclease domain-containing protein [Microbacterium sp. 4R-513]
MIVRADPSGGSTRPARGWCESRLAANLGAKLVPPSKPRSQRDRRVGSRRSLVVQQGVGRNARKFDPRDAGQLGFYVALVDDRLRLPDRHAPTVGILLVAAENETVVRHALAGTAQPVAVSRYELSPADQAALPAGEALTRLADEIAESGEAS